MTEQVDGVVRAARDVIVSEARFLDRLAELVDESFALAVKTVEQCGGRVVTTGLGKSGIAAAKIAAVLCSTGTPALYVHAGDAMHGDVGAVLAEDVVLALSRSGGTAEVCEFAAITQRRGAKVVAVTAVPDSPLAKTADLTLLLPSGAEADRHGFVPSSSFAAQTAIGDALAIVLMERGDRTLSDISANHPGGVLGQRAKSGVPHPPRPTRSAAL